MSGSQADERLYSDLLVHAVANLIAEKLQKMGIDLSTSQVEALKVSLDLDNLDKLQISLEPNQEATYNSLLAQEPERAVIAFEDDDLERIEKNITDEVADSYEFTQQARAKVVLRNWDAGARKTLRTKRKERRRFAKNLDRGWREAIGGLDLLISICLEAGPDFLVEHRDSLSENMDYVFEALTRLHARACQVASEILTLLSSGFADGAMARWRTLHEIDVIMLFLAEHGQELAKRYLAYSAVVNYNDAVHYQAHCKSLHREPLSDTEFAEAKLEKDEACNAYGKGFGRNYGWASDQLGDAYPTFVKIEKAVNLDHFRPIYKLANLNIHAGPKSAYFRLGSPPTGEQVLVAGPSVFGLDDPGQNTAISIQRLTVTHLITRPSEETMAFATASYEHILRVFNQFAYARDAVMEINSG